MGWWRKKGELFSNLERKEEVKSQVRRRRGERKGGEEEAMRR